MPLMVNNLIGFGVGAGTSGGVVTSLSISGTPVLTATEGVAYAGFTAVGDGGDPPYTFSLVGTWPAGISVNSSTGEVSGTPTESGTFASLSVRLTDQSAGTRDLPTFTLEVEAAATTWAESPTAPVTSDNPNDPHTFSGFDIGTAAADRVVVAVIGWGFSVGSTISGVTIGGVSASAAGSPANASSSNRVAIYYAVVPTGTTADVVVDFSTDITGGGVCKVYYGYPASSTPVDTGNGTAASGGVITLSDLEIGVGGILIAGRVGTGGDPASFGWTGDDAIETDEEGSANLVKYSFAHVITTEATSTDDLTCDPSGSSTNGMVAATWV